MARVRIAWILVLLAVVPAAAGFVTFESGQVRPLALSPDGTHLFAVDTPDDRLEIFTVGSGTLTHVDSVTVGLEPVAVAARTDSEVWVVNHLSDSVSIVDVGSSPPRVTRTLEVGDEPRDIVFAGGGRAFITTARRGQHGGVFANPQSAGIGRANVWVFNPDGTLLTIVTLFGDTPRALAVSPDGNTVYAAVFHSGNRTTSLSEGAVCDEGASAPPCTVGNAAGGFFTAPGGLPAPNTNFEGTARPETGLIVKLNPSTSRWEDGLGRNWSPAVRFSLPDEDVFAIGAAATPPVQTNVFAGVGTVLFNMATNPVSGKVYVSNTDARNEVRFEGPGTFGGSTVRGHLHEARITVLDGAAVVPRHLNKHIDYGVVPSPAGVKEKSLAIPNGLAVSADGATLYVAAFGSSAIGVFSTAALEDDSFVPDAASHIAVSGGGPSGIVLDEVRHQLYILTRFDDAISIIDTQTASEGPHVPLHNPEPASVVAGRPFLYDATITSSNGEASCASCHIFGDFDSLAWDLGNPDDVVRANPNPFRLGGPGTFHPMKGPMTTQSLRGLANHGPMHWRGDRTGGATGGDPLDDSLAFKAFNVAFDGLLGRGGALTDAQMQAFTDFILQVTYPPNPIRALDNSLTEDERIGRNFFLNSDPSDSTFTCNGCHVLDPANGFFGTDGRSSFENEPQLVKIPHLRNAYQKVGMFGMPPVQFFNGGDNGNTGDQVRGFGFLHDGSVDTLFRFHNAAVFNTTTPFGFPNPGGFPDGAEGDILRRRVELFILAFDSNLAPIVGQQATLDASAAAGPVIDLMVARAALGECDLTVKGVLAGLARGWYRRADGLFQSDRNDEAPIGDATLRAQASVAGQERTYTCVPPGSALRVGVDRDEDGVFDRTEIDHGSDPANAASVPAGVTTTVTVTTTSTTTTTLFFVTIRATSLTLADDALDASRRKLSFRSSAKLDTSDHRIVTPPQFSQDDPTVSGGTLTVYNSGIRTTDLVTLLLPASGWSHVGTRGYRYRGDVPKVRISMNNDKLSVHVSGASWGYTLDEPLQRRVAVRLTVGPGPYSWCSDAPAKISGNPPSTARNDHAGRFSGLRNASPLGFGKCPPLP